MDRQQRVRGPSAVWGLGLPSARPIAGRAGGAASRPIAGRAGGAACSLKHGALLPASSESACPRLPRLTLMTQNPWCAQQVSRGGV